MRGTPQFAPQGARILFLKPLKKGTPYPMCCTIRALRPALPSVHHAMLQLSHHFYTYHKNRHTYKKLTHISALSCAERYVRDLRGFCSHGCSMGVACRGEPSMLSPVH